MGGAEFQVIIDRFVESLLDLVDALAMKGDDIAGVKDFTVKNTSVCVQLNVSCITFVLQHIFSSQILTRRKAIHENGEPP